MGDGGNGSHRHGFHSGDSGDWRYYDQLENRRNGGYREESGQLITSVTSLPCGGDGDTEIGDQMSSITHGCGRGYVNNGRGSDRAHTGVTSAHGYKDVPSEYINRQTQEARPYSKKR